MKNIIKLTSLAILIISLYSCSSESKRYVVLGGGDTPVFLDTKTNEVYVIMPYKDGTPDIFKKSLSEAK